MKKIDICRLILLALLLVAAAAAPAFAQKDKLRVLSMPYLGFAPFFIAKENGYFEKYNLDVEFVELRRSSQAIPLLAQGELDVVAGTNSLSIYNAIASGADIKIVAGRGYISAADCVSIGIVAGHEIGTTAERASADQIRGRRAAVNLKSSSAFIFERFLQKYGLTLEDVVIVDAPNSIKAEAFKNNSIDFAYASEPWISKIIRSGNAEVFVPAYDLAMNYDISMILFGPSLLNDNPDAGTRFIKAFLEAVAEYSYGKTDRNVEMISRHTKLSPELLRSVCWQSVRVDGMINIDSTRQFMEWGLNKNLLDRVLKTEEFWDPSFIQKAARE